MADSSIEWTQKVWNPTVGCNKVSPGCKFCYAERMHHRLMKIRPEKYSRPFLDGAFEYEPALPIPFGWKKSVMIFPDSMSDLFHHNISIEFIAKAYAVMFLTPQHTYQMLTKRPERRLEVFSSNDFFFYLWKYCNQYHDKYIKPLEQELYFQSEIQSMFPFKNIWEGTSTEDQQRADLRIPILAQTPAAIRWISAEPLIGEIDLNQIPGSLRLDWIVTGGESGPEKRYFNADWFRKLRDFSAEKKIKFFMKQMDKVQEIPKDLMVREYPKLAT